MAIPGSTTIHIEKTPELFTVHCTNKDSMYNLVTLLAAYDQMARKFIAEHTCMDEKCVAVELTEQMLHEMDVVRHKYAVVRQCGGISENVDLRRVFILAMNDHKQPELISIDTLLRQRRFEDIDRWFEIQVKQCIGIKPGMVAKTLHFQNMVEFLRKNGARMVDLDAFARAWENIQTHNEETKETGAQEGAPSA